MKSQISSCDPITSLPVTPPKPNIKTSEFLHMPRRRRAAYPHPTKRKYPDSKNRNPDATARMASLLSLSAIEFPGVLRKSHDPRNAIAALGGEDAVRAALSIQTPASSLTLNLRPHPTASPSNISSEKPYSPTNLFLLRISTGPTLDLGPAPLQHHPHEARILGRVTSLVRFRALADFQYHVSRSIPTSTPITERHIATHTVFEALANYPKPSGIPTPQNLLDTLRPRRFARSQPEYGLTDYMFKQYAFSNVADPHTRHTLVPGRPLGDDRRSDANRLSLLHHRVTIDVDRVPQCPPDADHHPVQRGRETYGELYQLLSKLFQIRPIWIRRALYDGIPQHLRKSFKKAISMIAYSFQGTGPFYQAWIRYGYDPRKDPSSRQYQVVEVRITNAVILAAQSAQHQQTETEATLEEGTATVEEDSQYPAPFRMPASFTLTKIPNKKNNFIQVCDIKLDDVIKVCQEEEATKDFDPKFGFFTEAGFQRLITTVKKTLFSICEERLGIDRAREILGGAYNPTKRMAKKRKRLYLKDVIKPKGDQPSSSVPAMHTEQGDVIPFPLPTHSSEFDSVAPIDPNPIGPILIGGGEAVAQVADLVEEEGTSEVDEDAVDEEEGTSDVDEDRVDDDLGHPAEETREESRIEGFEILGEDEDEEDSEHDYD